MLDPDIRRLLDTVFNVPQGTAEPDLAQLRAAAEIAPELLGGEPMAIGSIADASVPGDAATVAVRIYRPSAGSPMPLCSPEICSVKLPPAIDTVVSASSSRPLPSVSSRVQLA